MDTDELQAEINDLRERLDRLYDRKEELLALATRMHLAATGKDEPDLESTWEQSVKFLRGERNSLSHENDEMKAAFDDWCESPDYMFKAGTLEETEEWKRMSETHGH